MHYLSLLRTYSFYFLDLAMWLWNRKKKKRSLKVGPHVREFFTSQRNCKTGFLRAYWPVRYIYIYIHDSVHRDSILIRSNEMQQYAGVYLLQNYSTCFGCLSHTTSGVHQTVTAAPGRSYCQSNKIRPRWRKVVALTLWPVPEAAVTVWRTLDDGCERHPKYVE